MTLVYNSAPAAHAHPKFEARTIPLVPSYLLHPQCGEGQAWRVRRPGLAGRCHMAHTVALSCTILALVLFGGTPPPSPPPRIRNGGRRIKRMIGVPGIELKKNRNAFPRHRGSWTSTNSKMNRDALNISIFTIGPPKNFFKSSPFSPYEIPPN